MQRQIVLDTETTGLQVEAGHRIIEIGCVEMIDRKLTGKTFHHYINPEREIDAGALAVHGITNDFLHDKPIFRDIAAHLMEFISGAELIIHNAPFDLSFLDHELALSRAGWKSITNYCTVTDTLLIARKLHVGQRNNLDALCKRYYVENTRREYHGALLDAHLLAQVYLAMTGGQGNFFEQIQEERRPINSITRTNEATTPVDSQLILMKADSEERQAHENYLDMLEKKGNCLWRLK